MKKMKKLFILIPILMIAGLLSFNASDEMTSLEKDAAIGSESTDTMTTNADPGGW